MISLLCCTLSIIIFFHVVSGIALLTHSLLLIRLIHTDCNFFCPTTDYLYYHATLKLQPHVVNERTEWSRSFCVAHFLTPRTWIRNEEASNIGWILKYSTYQEISEPWVAFPFQINSMKIWESNSHCFRGMLRILQKLKSRLLKNFPYEEWSRSQG